MKKHTNPVVLRPERSINFRSTHALLARRKRAQHRVGMCLAALVSLGLLFASAQ